MKALSIYPDPVMDIFMGLKTIEYRTWSTDYRGDLLICAGAKKEPGLVNGYAWFVVSLLDILPFDAGWGDGSRGYEWVLGEPRLIRPIPVRQLRKTLFSRPSPTKESLFYRVFRSKVCGKVRFFEIRSRAGFSCSMWTTL